MTNDNDNVINLSSVKGGKEEEKTKPLPGTWEFHLHPTDDGPEDVVTAKGFLKFGPQFLAVTSSSEDDAPMVAVVALPLVRFCKRIDAEEAIQGTLSL